MGKLLLVLCLVAAPLFSAESRFLLLPDFAPALTRDLQPSQLVYTDEGVSVVQLEVDQIALWSERVHAELGGCGGFLDVTEEVLGGKAPERLVWEEALRQRSPAVRRYFEVTGRPEISELVRGADEGELWSFLKELTDFPDRSATTDNGTKAAHFLKGRADQLGKGIEGFTTWTVATGTSTYAKQPSVVASLPGLDPALPHVVIGAHMDTFSPGKPGADDDGSGTAVVMEALRVVASSGAKFQHPVDFIWYAAEERGLVGSGYVVRKFQERKIAVAAAIQFDMTGYKGDEKDIYLITDYTDSGLTQSLRQMITTYTDAKVGETKCGYACSDHASWNRIGVPVVFPFETSFGKMNYRLHTADDKMSYLSAGHAVRFAQAALAFLGEIAKLK